MDPSNFAKALTGSFLLAANSVSAVNKVDTVKSEIISIHSFSEIREGHPEGTLFMLDMDETSTDFPHSLGSAGFRRWIRAAAQKIDDSRNWHDHMTHYLCENYRQTVPVEKNIPDVIESWKEKNYVVVGFTARERNKWYDTDWENVDEMSNQQLIQANIHFDDNGMAVHYPCLRLNSEYYKGMFYANTDLKGDFINILLEGAPKDALPVKVVFVDDKDTHVASVAKALEARGIPCESYHYKATEAKTKAFQPILGGIELYYFLKEGKVLSDEEAEEIAKIDSDKTAEWYLSESLEIFKQLEVVLN